MNRLIAILICCLCLVGCSSQTRLPDSTAAPRAAPVVTAAPKFDPLDIPTKEVESTAISRIGYDPEEKVLLIQFKESGVYYCYYEVPKSVYLDFIAAESIGRYFNQEIKGQYDYDRLT